MSPTSGWTKIFVGAKIIDVLASDGSKDAALLIKTTSCDRVIVTASHFMPFAEETTLSIAASTFKSFFALAKIRHKAGKMTGEHLRNMQRIFGTFLSRWLGLGGTLEEPSGSFYNARHLALDAGVIAPPPPPGVLTVSKPLGMHYLVVLYMWHSLGRDLFALLYRCCGLGVSNGTDDHPAIPFDQTFRCPVCKGNNGHRADSANQTFCALADCPDPMIQPLHCCFGCKQIVYDAEKKTCAEALANGVDLTEEQHRRAEEGQKLLEREREAAAEEQREKESMARLSAKRIRAAQIEAEERQVLQAQQREAEEPQAEEKVKLRRKAEESRTW